MFGWFKNDVPIIEATPDTPPTNLVDYIGWRNNMWVVTPDGIGIVVNLGTEVDVHIVDGDGYTVYAKTYPILALRQAKYEEIPLARRGLDKDTASGIGYK